MPQKIAIVGAGVSGLGAAYALHHDPDRFDFTLFEAHDRIGGNAITADMPQDDGTSIPFDISVTACIPSVYEHIVLLMERFGIDMVDSRFSYSVKYRGEVYAHDFDSEIREQLQDEIARFQRLRRRSGVVVEDHEGVRESFDGVIFACNANQTLMMLDSPTMLG